MKNIIFACLIILGFAACKKGRVCNDMGSFNTDYFEFGYSGGFAGIHKNFVISGGKLYQDDTNHLPLPDYQYQNARVLIVNFPAYLLAHPNQDYGCLGCADQLVIKIRARVGGSLYTWNIDVYKDALPVEIRDYEELTYNTIEAL